MEKQLGCFFHLCLSQFRLDGERDVPCTRLKSHKRANSSALKQSHLPAHNYGLGDLLIFSLSPPPSHPHLHLSGLVVDWIPLAVYFYFFLKAFHVRTELMFLQVLGLGICQENKRADLFQVLSVWTGNRYTILTNTTHTHSSQADILPSWQYIP